MDSFFHRTVSGIDSSIRRLVETEPNPERESSFIPYQLTGQIKRKIHSDEIYFSKNDCFRKNEFYLARKCALDTWFGGEPDRQLMRRSNPGG